MAGGESVGRVETHGLSASLMAPVVYPASGAATRLHRRIAPSPHRAIPLSDTYRVVYDTYTYGLRDRCAAMKKKLTVTIDAEVLPRAKRFARSNGVSLSSLIERSLRDVTEDETSTFATKWRGRFKAVGRDDLRYDALARKYL